LVWSSPESHKFSSSGLNLSSEGLLLGVSLRTILECTRSDPCQSDSQIPNIFNYANVFFREARVPVASMRMLGWIGSTKVCLNE
jgi:hypothetical protein